MQRGRRRRFEINNMNTSVLVQYVIALIFLAILSVPISNSETILGERNDDFDFDGLPGVSQEFKVDVRAGEEACFFQPLKEGVSFHFAFQVSLYKLLYLIYIHELTGQWVMGS